MPADGSLVDSPAMTPGLSADGRSVLASSTAFAPLDAVGLEALADAMEEVRLAPGATLVRQGEAGEDVFVILDGELETILERPGGADQPIAVHGAGELIGELAFLDRGVRQATVRATSDSVVGVIAPAVMEAIVEDHPGVAGALASLSVARMRRSQLAAYLTGLFGIVDRRIVDEVEAAIEYVSIPAGEVLFREGDAGGDAYIVLSGRLRVAVARADAATVGPEAEAGERVVADVARGETVGEIALLTGEVRSATVYAVRDADLARITKDAFDRLAGRHPEVMLHVAEVLGARLRQLTAGVAETVVQPLTLVLVPAHGDVPVEPFAAGLAAALARHAPTALVTREAVAAVAGDAALAAVHHGHPASLRLGHWLDEQEAGHQYVVCVADGAWSTWTERIVRRADRVLVVADARRDPAPGDVERRLAARWTPSRSPRRTLVLLHDPEVAEPRGTAAWLADRPLHDHLHVRRDVQADVERVARTVTGRGISLVLGGGGARGFAHVGVLRAIEELGIPIDLVGGTSMGAVIGATAAMGWTSAEIMERSRPLFARILDVTLPIVSVLAGRRIWQSLERAFGDRQIVDLWLPFFTVSSNLTRAERLVDRTGSLRWSIRSSLSLPGVLPPVYRDGDLVVDGGILDNVPVDVMRELNDGGPIIAVDVSPSVDLASSTPFEPVVSGWALLRRRLNPFSQSLRLPGLVDLLNRSAVLGSVYLRNRARSDRPGDLYLQIPGDQWRLLEFDAAAPIAARGYEQALEPLRAWWAAREA